MSTSSKRTPSTVTETREAPGAGPPASTPRPPRGASAIPAPRKAELHRVALSSRPLPTHEQIARRAYELWVQSGYLSGRDGDNWTQAERELSTGCAGAESSAQQG